MRVSQESISLSRLHSGDGGGNWAVGAAGAGGGGSRASAHRARLSRDHSAGALYGQQEKLPSILVGTQVDNAEIIRLLETRGYPITIGTAARSAVALGRSSQRSCCWTMMPAGGWNLPRHEGASQLGKAFGPLVHRLHELETTKRCRPRNDSSRSLSTSPRSLRRFSAISPCTDGNRVLRALFSC